MEPFFMKKRYLASWFCLAAFVMVLSWAGCGTTTSIYGKVPLIGPRSDLKKRVLLMPIVNQTGLEEERVEELTDDLIEHLRVHKFFDRPSLLRIISQIIEGQVAVTWRVYTLPGITNQGFAFKTVQDALHEEAAVGHRSEEARTIHPRSGVDAHKGKQRWDDVYRAKRHMIRWQGNIGGPVPDYQGHVYELVEESVSMASSQ